jgi:GT2 family glycosyltransferase
MSQFTPKQHNPTSSDQLVVVLGMHRSGTSTITKALAALGMNLGDKHLPPRPDNPKGFWEDTEMVAFNESLLVACGKHWFSLEPITPNDVLQLERHGYFQEAADLLERKLSRTIFAFKDPRTSKLLPFWIKVFEQQKIVVRYVLALRDPFNVAQSLINRGDQFSQEKSYGLWLSYVLTCLIYAPLRKTYPISYDDLLKDPRSQLEKLSEWFGIKPSEASLQAYCQGYLDPTYRTQNAPPQTFETELSALTLAKEIHKCLLNVSEGSRSLESLTASGELERWRSEFERMGPLLRFVDRQDLQITELNRNLNQRVADIELLRSQASELQRQLAEQESLALERLTQLDHLKQSRSWRYTAPLRALGDLARRYKWLVFLKRAAFLVSTPSGRARLRSLAEHKGGFINLFRVAVSFIRQNGLRLGYKRAVYHVMGQASALALMYDTHHDYGRWIQEYERIDDERLSGMRSEARALNRQPVFSVVMPVYNPPIHFLCLAIESVINQVYPHWELCIADDASTDPDVLACLRRYEARDSRIKIIHRPSNGHISAASNSALTLATGEFVALLDQDDILPSYALLKVAQAIDAHPQAQLLYSDEDKIDGAGNRFHPYFKTDWNPDLIYSHNMFSHLGVYKRELIEKVGGFRQGFEGSQDYDLMLRCLEQVSTETIFHIPHVLYHWRAHEGSTSVTNQAKPYAMIAGERAINEHLQRRNVKGHVELENTGYRIYYDMPERPPVVSIIIPTRDKYDLVETCIKSIHKKTEYPHVEIIVVDNGSVESESFRARARLEQQGVRIVRDDDTFNFSRLNNRAALQAKGDVLCLLNNDTEVVSSDWLNVMVSHALQPGVGAVGARLLFPDATVQHAGVILGLKGVAGHSHYTFPEWLPGYFGRVFLTSTFSAVTGACLVVRRDLYQEVGGLDEEHLAVAFNDVDFCLKLTHKGYRCVYAADAVLIHHESVSRGEEDDPVKVARIRQESDVMYARWGHLIRNDPFYSPNLTLDAPDFGLAWPPRVESL